MKRLKYISYFILFFIYSTSVWSQKKEVVFNIYYANGSYSIEHNKKLDSICFHINKDSTIESIEIHAYSSPLSGKKNNEKLAMLRLESFRKIIIDSTKIAPNKIKGFNHGIDWTGLSSLVNNTNILQRKRILNILENTPEEIIRNNILVDSRNSQLMMLSRGAPYAYMAKHLFPKLRRTTIIIVYNQLQPIKKNIKEIKEITGVIKNTNIAKSLKDSLVFIDKNPPILNNENIIDTISNNTLVESIEVTKKPRRLIALKTNLLFDLALSPNIELEIPLSKKFSLNAEIIYADWLKKDNTFCWQILAGGIEGRYWFNSTRTNKPLSGWFLGGFTSGGFYDFQIKENSGYQGEFYLLAGLSWGYTKSIGKNLGLELSAGFGYFVTDYRKYKIVNNELIKDGLSMRFRSVSPAKLKCSIIWYINHKLKKGGK